MIFAAMIAALLSLSAFAQDQQAPAKPKAFRLSLTFNKQDKETQLYKQVWPFSAPARDVVPTKASEAISAGQEMEFTGLEKYGSYKYKVFSTKGISRSSKNGFVFGGAVGDYIVIPAVEGKFLSSIAVSTGEGGLVAKPSIQTMDGQVLKGGAAKKELKDKEGNILDMAAEGAKARYSVKGCQSGETYKFVLTEAEMLAIRRISFYYKDVVAE